MDLGDRLPRRERFERRVDGRRGAHKLGMPTEAPDHAIRRPVGERGSVPTVRLKGRRTQIGRVAPAVREGAPFRAFGAKGGEFGPRNATFGAKGGEFGPGSARQSHVWRQRRGIRPRQRPAKPRLAPKAGNPAPAAPGQCHVWRQRRRIRPWQRQAKPRLAPKAGNPAPAMPRLAPKAGIRGRRPKGGAGDGLRTRYLNFGKVALYRLSYSRPAEDEST
jgi:hypothetical protein